MTEAGKSGEEMGRREWTIQTNLQHADLFAPRGEHLHRLACGLRAGAHQDQHAFGVGRAFVLERARSGVPVRAANRCMASATMPGTAA